MTRIGEPQRVRTVEPFVIPVPDPEPAPVKPQVPEKEPDLVPVNPRREREDE